MARLPAPSDPSGRVLSGLGQHEDAFILAPPPPGWALAQSVDILSPLGNDPRRFGQTAAANALSDIYAMGGEAYSAMNILAFPSCDTPLDVLREILQGAAEKLAEAEAVGAGGHTLEDAELKFGLSVTGLVPPKRFARNSALEIGDLLVLTKPIGTGVLATAIKARWDGAETAEETLYAWTTRLNRKAASVLRALDLRAATDVTGFGLGGHALEMAAASHKSVHLSVGAIPFMPSVLDYAKDGFIPQGSYANRDFAASRTSVDPGVDAMLHTLAFDAQTSGGLLLAVPESRLSEAVDRLQDLGEAAYVVGFVDAYMDDARLLVLER